MRNKQGLSQGLGRLLCKSRLIRNGFVLALAMFAMAGGPVFAQMNLSTSQCVISKIDGERVPFPLRKANTKFELAENETYLLNGTIVVVNGRTLFKVDFATQPWLETEKMLQFPYIPLDDATHTVNQFAGRMVQMAVVATKFQTYSPIEGGGTGVSLRVILPPIPMN
jgi:hypothetical protein